MNKYAPIDDVIFFDSHLHCKGFEARGFILGMEGCPIFEGTYTNVEARTLACLSQQRYHYFEYVTSGDIMSKRNVACLKYHPRREGYSVDAVIESIKLNDPRCVMIDTLNEPYWTSYDYWRIAKQFPEKKFIFPHAGGYLVNDFIKICHFQRNVWIDFSLTHSNFGAISSNPMPTVDLLIAYALNATFSDRILLGTDNPFFNQMDVVKYYGDRGFISKLNENFLNLEALL